MTDIMFYQMLQGYALCKNHNAKSFNDLGSIRHTASMVIGMNVSAYPFYLDSGNIKKDWSSRLAVAKVLNHFEDSPSIISAAMLVAELSRYSPKQNRFQCVLAAAETLASAQISKYLIEYTELQDDKIPGTTLANILLANDFVTMIQTIDVFKDIDISLRGLGFGECQEKIHTDLAFRQNNYTHAHPVLRDFHKQTLDYFNELFGR